VRSSLSERYCSKCGSALNPNEETGSRHIGSKLADLAGTLWSFVTTVWLVLRAPRRLLASFLTATSSLSEPSSLLAIGWRPQAPVQRRVIPPIQCLAIAVGFAAALAGLPEWARQTAFIRPQSAAQHREQLEQEFRVSYEQRFGRPLIVRTDGLSGWPVIDVPAHAVISLLEAMSLPLVVLLLLRHPRVDRLILIRYYGYAVAAALTAIAICDVMGSAGMLALVHTTWPDLLVLGFVMLPSVASPVAMGYFVLLVPIVVFPQALPLTRSRVVSATVVGALVSWAAKEIVRRVSPALGVMWM
jgi:hypothetical protein